MHLVATCAFGLEKLLVTEIKKLGLWVLKTEDGRVTFEGDEEDIVRTNLWLRTAGRVHIKMGEGIAKDFDTLFAKVKSIAWENYIGERDMFPVMASSAKSALHSEPAIQSIVKKAVAQRLAEVYKRDPLPESSNAFFQIRVHANKDNFLFTIDTSGESLHKRGYRTEANLAPIKETLAAALVMLSDWTPEKKLVDPFCGSGTILLEAALIARNIAPGLRRTFSFHKWPWMDPRMIMEVYQDARAQSNQELPLILQGYDLDPQTLTLAKHNAERAGIENIHFQCNDFQDLPFGQFQNCTFITNPPYGERLDDKEHVQELYARLGEKYRETKNSSLFIITPEEEFQRLFGAQAEKNRKLFNGNIKCYFYSYFAKSSEEPTPLL